MQQKNRRFKVLMSMLLEVALLMCCYNLSVFIRFSVLRGEISVSYYSPLAQGLMLIFSLCVVYAYWLWHLYRSMQRMPVAIQTFRVLMVNTVATLALTAALFLTRIIDFSRGAVLLFYLTSTLVICSERIVRVMIARKRFREGIGLQHVILVGSGSFAQGYCRDIKAYPQYGRVLDGYIANTVNERCGTHLGAMDQVEQILEGSRCDEVVVALEPEEVPYLQLVLNAVSKAGLRVSVIPFYRDYLPSHPTFEQVGKSLMIDLRATPLDNLLNAFAKRVMDIVGAATMLLLLSPVLLVTAIGVKLGSPGPILFRQKRIGLNKKEFTMLKFRSMRVNAEENTGWSRDQDPRRTRFGQFIRKYSIDELPQLWNVLRGDMSLVGPRPELPYFVYQFKESVPLYLVRQQVRPGLTGWAQIHGLRGDTSIQERVKYDIWYIENWSVLLDIQILIRTALGGFINNEDLSAPSGGENEE